MTAQPKRTGVIVGKFMPLHKGHEFIINFAINLVDELTVLVDNVPDSVCNLPLADRVEIARKTFPNAIVKGIDVVTYQEPHDAPDFWEFWRDTMIRNVGYTPDYVIGSMDYVRKLADYMGCDYVILDQSRTNYPISATMIRNGMSDYKAGLYTALDSVWRFVSEHTRLHYLNHVYIVGGESVGKTTLSKYLAQELNATYVEEYARILIEEKNGIVLEKDMYTIATAQRAIQDVMKRHSKLFCFHDTDLITTKIWYKKLFGEYPAWIEDMIASQSDGMYIILKPTAKWEDDVTRYFPEDNDRDWFHTEFKTQLDYYGKTYIEIDGTLEQRFDQVLDAIGIQ